MTSEKKKRHPIAWIALGVLILITVLTAALLSNFPKALSVSDSAVNLELLEDGIYRGEFDNGLVYASVEVSVRDNAIVDITIMEHRSGRGEKAEIITDSVIAEQSLRADAVTGATASSQTILKAIENALSE